LIYSLDANVLRCICHNDAGAAAVLLKLDSLGFATCGISAIVAYELHRATLNFRLTRSTRSALSAYLAKLPVIAFDGEDAAAAAQLEREIKGNTPGVNDLMIAAQARRRGLVVVTDNVKHFQRVPRLVVENWLKP
jgi:tRNA(fMet)-specific endonuclease VapC